MSENLDDGNLPSGKPTPGQAPPKKGNNGAAAQAIGGTSVEPPPGDNVVPLPAKKTGLTLESLKRATVSGDAAPLVAITSVPVIIDVTKPTKGAPFRAHPDPAYTMNGYSLTVKTPGVIGETVYLVDPAIAEMIPAHVRYQRFCLCYDAWQLKLFIWPVNIPIEGERGNSWVTSANRIWNAAKEDWVCLIPVGGAYQLHKPALPVKGEAVWPDKPFAELMIMGFKDLYIGPDDHNHPEVAKRLTVLIPE